MSYAAYSLLCRCQDSFIQKALGDDMYTSIFFSIPSKSIRARSVDKNLVSLQQPQCQPSELFGFLENVLSADYVLATENSRISAASASRGPTRKELYCSRSMQLFRASGCACNNVFRPPVAPAPVFFFSIEGVWFSWIIRIRLTWRIKHG
jgi:hypothetical protein